MKASPLLATAIIFCALISAAEASLTYQIPSYPGEVDGWSLDGGHITTDGTLGPITTENLESFEVRFTSPAGPGAISSGKVSSVASWRWYALGTPDRIPSLIATDRSLIFPDISGSQDLVFELILAEGDITASHFTGKVLSFRQGAFTSFMAPLEVDPAAHELYGFLVDTSVDPLIQTHWGFLSRGDSTNTSGLQLREGSTVVASIPVPEPTTALLIALGSGLLLFRRASRCPALLLALTIACVFAGEAQASLTYEIAPLSGEKEGWSLDGGFITTDGTLGAITTENLESWEFRLTSPTGSSIISSEGGGVYEFAAAQGDAGLGSLSANFGSLFFASERKGPNFGFGTLRLVFSNQNFYRTDFSGQAVWIDAFFPPGGSTLRPFFFAAQSTIAVTLIDGADDPTRESFLLNSPKEFALPNFGGVNVNRSRLVLPDGPFSLASIPVPEPTTALLIALGSGLLLFRRASRCPALLLALTIACVFSDEAQASLTYEIAPRPGEKDGWSFDGGSITTNGTLGGLDYDDILGWEIRFTSPAGPTVLNSEEHYFQMIYLRFTTVSCEAGAVAGEPTSYGLSDDCNKPTEPLLATETELNFNDAHNQVTDLAFSDVALDINPVPGKAFRGIYTGGGDVRFVGSTSAIIIVDNSLDALDPIGFPFNNRAENANWSSLQSPSASDAFASIPVPEPTTLMLAASLFMLVLRLPRTFGR